MRTVHLQTVRREWQLIFWFAIIRFQLHAACLRSGLCSCSRFPRAGKAVSRSGSAILGHDGRLVPNRVAPTAGRTALRKRRNRERYLVNSQTEMDTEKPPDMLGTPLSE